MPIDAPSAQRAAPRCCFPLACVTQEALAADRGNTLLSLLLVHVYVVAGRLGQALAAAQAAAASAPHDADARALVAVAQQLVAAHSGGAQQGGQDGDGGDEEEGDDAEEAEEEAEEERATGAEQGEGAEGQGGDARAGQRRLWALRRKLEGVGQEARDWQRDAVQWVARGHRPLLPGGLPSGAALGADALGGAGGRAAAAASAGPASHLDVLLRSDPLCCLALSALLAGRAHCVRCRAAALLGCLAHLDMQGSVPDLPLGAAAWACLGEGLMWFAEAVAGCVGVSGAASSVGRERWWDGVGGDAEGGMEWEREGGFGGGGEARGGASAAVLLQGWVHVKQALEERAGWWPAQQLQEEDSVLRARGDRAARGVLAAAAHMLGPLHPHTEALAQSLSSQQGDGAGDGAWVAQVLELSAACVEAGLVVSRALKQGPAV